MNKQQLFRDAHKQAKSLAPSMGYRKAFKYALAICYNNADKYKLSSENKIDRIAKFLVSYTGNSGKYKSFSQQAELAATLLHQATLVGGFAQQVSNTVISTNRISDKQAFVIAKALVENNRTNQFAF